MNLSNNWINNNLMLTRTIKINKLYSMNDYSIKVTRNIKNQEYSYTATIFQDNTILIVFANKRKKVVIEKIKQITQIKITFGKRS